MGPEKIQGSLDVLPGYPISPSWALWVHLTFAMQGPATRAALLSAPLYSEKLEHGCRMIYVVSPSFFGLGLKGMTVQLSVFYCEC